MYENYKRIRDGKGLTDYKVSIGAGVSKVTLSDWKNNKTTPKTATIKKIAEFLEVSVDDIVGLENSRQTYYLNDETAKMAQAIFENKEMRLLFDCAKDASPEDLQTVHAMLLALKRKEQKD